jgi:hypothetical protein
MRTAVLALMVTVGCTGLPADESICDQAAEHLGACLGQSVAVAESCDVEAAALAERALSTSCDQMVAADAKADGQSGGIATTACIALAVPIFAHGLDEGAACCFDYNCEGALVCHKFTCKAKQPVGGACERENHCQGDLGCNFDKCIVKLGEGKACDRHAACAGELVCAPDDRCRPALADGASCDDDGQCASATCHRGRCATAGQVGAACDSQAPCDDFLQCVEGRCASTASSGGACNDESFFACPSDETCWQGRCEPRHPAGGRCLDIFDCAFPLFCTGGICGN